MQIPQIATSKNLLSHCEFQLVRASGTMCGTVVVAWGPLRQTIFGTSCYCRFGVVAGENQKYTKVLNIYDFLGPGTNKLW